MNVLSLFDTLQQGQQVLGVTFVAAGLWLLWRGLRGGQNGRRGLLRGNEPALARAEGWRVAVLGFVVAGLGLAALTSSPLLFYLFLGIGFVELWEASFVIAVWRHGDAQPPRSHTT